MLRDENATLRQQLEQHGLIPLAQDFVRFVMQLERAISVKNSYLSHFLFIIESSRLRTGYSTKSAPETRINNKSAKPGLAWRMNSQVWEIVISLLMLNMNLYALVLLDMQLLKKSN